MGCLSEFLVWVLRVDSLQIDQVEIVIFISGYMHTQYIQWTNVPLSVMEAIVRCAYIIIFINQTAVCTFKSYRTIWWGFEPAVLIEW